MGWFSKALSWGKKAVGWVGGTAKKIGSFAVDVTKKLGEYAPLVGNLVGTALDVVAIGLAQPELAIAGEAVRAGGMMIGSYSDMAHKHAKTVERFGDKTTSLYKSWGDDDND